MRTNLPVLDREYDYPDDMTLVSTTDTKGRITYCNPAFIQVSGYERDELLGQPHNMIRHPDMPVEAFRDMWQTIQEAQPWSALVKNRRKNGECYWVRANVTPLLEGDRVVGYMSVRTRPARGDVRAAQTLYRRLNDDAARGRRGLSLRAGQLCHPGLRGLWQRATRLALDHALIGLTLPATLAAYALGGWATGATAGRPWMPWAGAALAVGLGALAGGLATRAAVTPLKGLLQLANRMAAGDLTCTIQSRRHDLIGRLFLAMAQLNVNLRSIVRDARQEVEQMARVTQEIAAGNQELSSRTESQASSLEQTAASMEQITGTVRQNADAARQAATLSADAAQVTQRGSDVVREVTTTMQAISTSSARIGEIIQVIDAISFQTNILALNAAVEAARAGEQGRGFAVVASEVRSLAQRSAEAAKEIKQLITSSVARTEQGSALVDRAGDTMKEVVASIHRVTDIMGEISSASAEQSIGVTHVGQAITQMDQSTQQNAALVEEMAAAASSLNEQAQELVRSMSVFRFDQARLQEQALPEDHSSSAPVRRPAMALLNA